MVTQTLRRDGFAVLPHDAAVLLWANAANQACDLILADAPPLRHGATWFVGVDALPNAVDGSVGGVRLAGGWLSHVTVPAAWHRAQLSVIFPGYPQQDPQDSDSAHSYRLRRFAAHVDGLHAIGPARRRHLREAHGFIAGLPLNDCDASPLVVWPGSHHIMRTALADCYAGVPPAGWGNVDVTDTYQAARRAIFAQSPPVSVRAAPGQVVLLDRHLLHGVAPWGDTPYTGSRKIAYFRPIGPVADWLSPSF